MAIPSFRAGQRRPSGFHPSQPAMSKSHSFIITISNNLTEREGIDYLTRHATGFFYVDSLTRKLILDLLGQAKSFARAFDVVYIPRYEDSTLTAGIIEAHLDEIILVELKVTKKFLPENPKGFFFGATENEFNFGKRLGDKFRFCFVCLNPLSQSFSMLTLEDLEKRIRTRRIQYQINL
jgi:hypothetical protein